MFKERWENVKAVYKTNIPPFILDGMLRESHEEFKKICTHDLVIVTDLYGGNDIEAKCFHCGKEIHDKRNLHPSSKIIYAVGGSIPKEMKYQLFIEEYRKAILAGHSFEEFYQELIK